jgi:hypothetical protein
MQGGEGVMTDKRDNNPPIPHMTWREAYEMEVADNKALREELAKLREHREKLDFFDNLDYSVVDKWRERLAQEFNKYNEVKESNTNTKKEQT